MEPLADEELVKLLPALAEAARADSNIAKRFVPPRTGILEETAARRHQFVLGRRGVGKSTLLRKIESLGPDIHGEVIFVDIETLRGRPYPDVLIELLIELLTTLSRRLEEKAPPIDFNRARRRARRTLRDLISTLQRLLDEPQVAERVIKELQTRNRSRRLGGDLELSEGPLRARASADAEDGHSREDARESRVEESKMDGLLGAAVLIRGALAAAQEHLDEETILIVLDDFYHVPYDAQPDVLAYLHQIVKNRGIYLKICGVRHRIQPFVEGDPPRGLQLGQDAGVISLDITLERFTAAQGFLERLLAGICEPLQIDLNDLVSGGGRQRLVLGSGGVARDYLSLTAKALRIANERDANPSRLHNRISAEDVNEAAADLSAQKQEDLRLDAGKDANELRARLDDIVKFCLDVNKTNVFLVEGPTLEEKDWGKQIQGLADLRLVHQIGNLSVQTGSYRGRRFVGFTLDLSNYTGTRSERIKQIEFWTPTGKQDIRRAALIYEPGAGDRKPVAKQASARENDLLEGEWQDPQVDIYALLDTGPELAPE
jgi:energy-coupling factor transporter ATP-binding protein EcfA2